MPLVVLLGERQSIITTLIMCYFLFYYIDQSDECRLLLLLLLHGWQRAKCRSQLWAMDRSRAWSSLVDN